MKRIIKSSESTKKYVLLDTLGAPQAGCNETYFDEWYEVEDYVDSDPALQERLQEGYAFIREL